MQKQITFVRHAQSTFNEVYQETETYCPVDPWILDSPLSTLGHTQSKQPKQPFHVNDYDIIICSPFTRCLQTMINLFQLDQDGIQWNKRVTIHPLCREFQENSCDIGTSLYKLKDQFSRYEHLLDYTLVSENLWWYIDEEKAKSLELHELEATFSFEPLDHFEQRVQSFKDYLKQLDAKKVLVISHGVFIKHCTDGVVLDNCESTQIEI
jgi:broad specificity phosphatase PhoE